MKSRTKKVAGALGAGMAAGASLGVLGTYMFSSSPRLKKGAKKAAKTLSGIVEDIKDIM